LDETLHGGGFTAVPRPYNHSPLFLVAEAALLTGVRTLAHFAWIT